MQRLLVCIFTPRFQRGLVRNLSLMICPTNLTDLDPTSFRLHLSLAQTQLSLSRHPAALQSFSRLLELQPTYNQAHLWRGKILAKEGEFEKAREEVDRWEKGGAGGDAEEEGKELVGSPPATYCLPILADRPVETESLSPQRHTQSEICPLGT